MTLLTRRHQLLRPITFIDQKVFNDTTGNDHILSFPFVPAEGTLMLSYLPFYLASPVITVPSGWTQIANNNITAEPADYLYYKIAGPAETNSYNWHTTVPCRAGLCGLTLNSYNSALPTPWKTPIVKSTTGSGTDISLSTGNFNVSAESQVLIFYTKGGSPMSITSFPGGFTDILGIAAFGVRHKYYPAAATGENVTITWNTATGRNRTFTLEIRAAA